MRERIVSVLRIIAHKSYSVVRCSTNKVESRNIERILREQRLVPGGANGLAKNETQYDGQDDPDHCGRYADSPISASEQAD